MSGIIERLTEGVVNRDMRAEGNALLSKWEKTGLLEGLKNDRSQHTMARLLENQAKELLRESTSMAGGDVEGFAAVAFPIVRRVFAGLIANDLVSVQPMSLPSGLIFFMDFTYSGNLGASGSQTDRMGNLADKSIYGTDQVGSEITGGVDIVDARAGDLSGPRASARGYAYASPTGSVSVATGSITSVDGWAVGAETEAQLKKIDFDPDILAMSGSLYACEISMDKSVFTQPDLDNMSAWETVGDQLNNVLNASIASSDTSLARRLTKVTATQVKVIITSTVDLSSAAKAGSGACAWQYPKTDNLTSGGALGSVVGATEWGLEGSELIPEIDIKVDSIAVTAQTKKLKAKWTPELGQDLNAYHNLDAEVELTGILSEQIALEIDREILADLVSGATGATYYWARSPGMFLNRATGAEVGASTKAPDFTGTVSEWYETLAETINDVSAQIHRKTLRGGANFIVCSPEVANILEFTAGFRASVTHDEETGSVGAVKVGSLSKKFDVIVDPYFLRNVVLVGRRGSSFLESGYVYAPYVPLQTTPTIFGPDDFVPRKGVMTRYAKQMVRPDMYGLVVVRGLLGESGA